MNASNDAQYSSDIESAVKELVWRIIQKGLALKAKDVIKVPTQSEQPILFEGSFRDILPVSHLIPVGSFYEGTRVGNPFEYDFMFVIDVDVEVVDGCGPGYVNVKYPTNRNWRDLPSDHLLWSQIYEAEKYPSLDSIFSILFHTLTEDDTVMSEEEKTIHTSSGVLKALRSGYSFHIAAMWVNKDKEENVVSVDLRPAFRCPQEEIDKQELKGCFPPNLMHFVKEHGIFVIPKHCTTPRCSRCFLMSYATCEMELIKNMDDHHRKCYIILKSMISPKDMYEDSLTEVETYHVKTCLLFHLYELYPLKCEKVSTGDCILHILHMVIESFRDMKLSTFFRRELSVFESSSYASYKIDFIFHRSSELAHILHDNSDEEDTIIPSLMYLASVRMTQDILLMIRDILLYIKTGNVGSTNYTDFVEAIDNLHFALGYHFTGTDGKSVERNKWLPSLKPLACDLHVPIVSILKSTLLKNLMTSDISVGAKFPVQMIKVEYPKPKSCEGKLKDYISILESRWFSVAGNESCQMYYHKNY